MPDVTELAVKYIEQVGLNVFQDINLIAARSSVFGTVPHVLSLVPVYDERVFCTVDNRAVLRVQHQSVGGIELKAL